MSGINTFPNPISVSLGNPTDAPSSTGTAHAKLGDVKNAVAAIPTVGDLSQYTKVIHIAAGNQNLNGTALTNYVNITGTGYLRKAVLASQNPTYSGIIQIVIDGTTVLQTATQLSSGLAGFAQSEDIKGLGSSPIAPFIHMPGGASNALNSSVALPSTAWPSYNGALPTDGNATTPFLILAQPLYFKTSLQINLGTNFAGNTSSFGWLFKGMYK